MSLCLVALMLICMMPMSTLAAETESNQIQMMEEAIRNNAKAEVFDENGKLIETLAVDVQVSQLTNSRDVGPVDYLIVCTAREDGRVECPGSGSTDGILGTLLMVCRDEWGTSNTLISVTGNWSGNDSDTDDRTVTYRPYNVLNIAGTLVPNYNAPRQFEYYPKDYKGFTFKATSDAVVTSTGHNIHIEVATDPSVMDRQ